MCIRDRCKDCAKKLSPWFEERRHSTVEDIKKQLAYREQNKEAVRNFRVTRDLKADNNYHVFIDDNHQKFAIGTKMDVETNPDILDLSQVTSCRMDVEQDRTEAVSYTHLDVYKRKICSLPGGV